MDDDAQTELAQTELAQPELAQTELARPAGEESAGAGSSWSRDEWTWPVDVLPAELPDLPVAEPALPPEEAGRMPWLAALAAPTEPDAGHPPQPGRISLGFRDGSSTTLDPASEQAAALEELALLLTSSDDRA